MAPLASSRMQLLRPPNWRSRVFDVLLALNAPSARLLRSVAPIVHLPFTNTYFVTRRDDVREVFLNDAVYAMQAMENLAVILDEPPFMLGMGDTPRYRAQHAALRAVVPDSARDLDRLQQDTSDYAARLLAEANGRLEVVDFVRTITFDVLMPYFGLHPPHPDLQLWATRLFEFQFNYFKHGPALLKDPQLAAEAHAMAPKLRAYVDELIAAGTPGDRDVLSRCLARQHAGAPGYSPGDIRTALIGMLIAVPQLPIVLPRIVEQLLRRPSQLAAARQAALDPDPAVSFTAVSAYLFEAFRFDPLAPAVVRQTSVATTLAAGTNRATTIPAGSMVLPSFASAMRDGRRIADPECFDPTRTAPDYMHFGLGMHQCFGEAINRRMLPAMLQALLRYPIRRAPGAQGHLIRRGFFSDTLRLVWS